MGGPQAAYQRSNADDAMPFRGASTHCTAILDNFGIEITCRRGRNRNGYYIANLEELESNSLNRWLVENYSLSSILSEHRDLSDKILIEDIPSSREYLAMTLSALRLRQTLRISYRNFVGRGFEDHEFEPLCVKLFKRRWYMLAREFESKAFKILFLDRVLEMTLSNKGYIYPKDFSPKAFFAPYYGIIALTDQPPTDIVLRAYKELPGYLSSLPLHDSQEVIGCTEAYTDFRLRFVPTFDLVQELLLHREQLEVLAPETLPREVESMLKQIGKRYSDA